MLNKRSSKNLFAFYLNYNVRDKKISSIATNDFKLELHCWSTKSKWLLDELTTWRAWSSFI